MDGFPTVGLFLLLLFFVFVFLILKAELPIKGYLEGSEENGMSHLHSLRPSVAVAQPPLPVMAPKTFLQKLERRS